MYSQYIRIRLQIRTVRNVAMEFRYHQSTVLNLSGRWLEPLRGWKLEGDVEIRGSVLFRIVRHGGCVAGAS